VDFVKLTQLPHQLFVHVCAFARRVELNAADLALLEHDISRRLCDNMRSQKVKHARKKMHVRRFVEEDTCEKMIYIKSVRFFNTISAGVCFC
jgi:hypothetical protein